MIGRRSSCKDPVIWPDPAGTCWDKLGKATRRPLAILEWKARTEEISGYDETWLQQFSAKTPEFFGHAVSLDPKGTKTTMAVIRVRNGLKVPCGRSSSGASETRASAATSCSTEMARW